MKKLDLSQVTLVAVACTQIDETIYAMQKSMSHITYAGALLITHESRDLEHLGIKTIIIEKLDYKAYNHFIACRLDQYITTDFALIVQNDGYVSNPSKWDPDFLNYDYIGAPWAPNIHFTPDGKNVRIGNGGFSLRSKKLLGILNTLQLPFTDFGTGFFHEDGLICVHYRNELESAGIRFAPINVASRFSREKWCCDSVLFPFGFHNNKHYLGRYIVSRFKKLIQKIV